MPATTACVRVLLVGVEGAPVPSSLPVSPVASTITFDMFFFASVFEAVVALPPRSHAVMPLVSGPWSKTTEPMVVSFSACWQRC